LARRSHHSVQKRRRERAKQQKKQEKEERRRNKGPGEETDSDSLVQEYLGIATPEEPDDASEEETDQDENEDE
jgi:hypothetical protein